MNGERLQAILDKGYAISGRQTGRPHAVHRPSLWDVALRTPLYSIPASFDSKPSHKFAAPNSWGESSWYPLLDAAKVQVGDYLVGPRAQIYFVAAKQDLLPILCVECNVILDIFRKSDSVAGLNGYSALSNPDAIIRAWPASCLTQNSLKSGSDLPTAPDQRGGWRILLPASLPVSVKPSDIIVDNLGRRYSVNAAERTDLGWRISAQESVLSSK